MADFGGGEAFLTAYLENPQQNKILRTLFDSTSFLKGGPFLVI